MKRSYTLTKTQAANLRGLGVKPKKPGYSASAYPALPATLEETAESGPSRTETWVQKAKHNLEKKPNVGGKTEKVTTNDMTGQPPDYNQSMGWQPFMPQYNTKLQYGVQASSAGQGQYLLPMLHQQAVFMSPNPGPSQHLDMMGNLPRRPTEEDKAEEIKKKLEKRKIPTDDWQFYIKAMGLQ